MTELQKRILLHSLFWGCLIGVFSVIAYFSPANDGIKPVDRVLINALFFLFMAVPIYINLLWLFPKFLLKGKSIKYIILLGILLVGYSFLCWPLFNLIDTFFPNNGDNMEASGWMIPLYLFFQYSIFVVLTSGIKFARDWFRQNKRNKEIERQQLTSELKFLRTQVNPHFLFNTLNNLYALTLKKSDNAPDVVLKLSEMMRYMLYECEVKRVSLQKEIDYIKNYIALEELRLDDSSKIKLEIDGNINGQAIAPLLFTPLIENSIKHGLGTQVNNAWVNISIKLQDDNLLFSIQNSKHGEKRQHKDGGIGLINIKRRLELLYPQSHTLTINETETTYKVDLAIKLDELNKPSINYTQT